MSERTMQDIQTEYTQFAAKLGHIYCQIETLEREIPKIHEQVQALQLETVALAAKKNEVKSPE
jgi:hypothetical protein